MEFQLTRLIKIFQHRLIVFHHVDGPQFHGMTFKLDRDAHLAAGVGSTHIQETPLDATSGRRSTNAQQEVPRGRRKLKPITPLRVSKGLHAPLFLMRSIPHGVLETSAKSIPNFATKNKVLTHFFAILTQFSAK